MGAEWPAGAALAMESWLARSRGFMSGVLQGSWGLGFALSALAYGFLFDVIGWRGLLWIGVLPALVVVSRLPLADRRALDCVAGRRHVLDLEGEHVTTAKLAVDRHIEHGEPSSPALDHQARPD